MGSSKQGSGKCWVRPSGDTGKTIHDPGPTSELWPGPDVPWGEHGPLACPGMATSVLGLPRLRSPSKAEAQGGGGWGVPRRAVCAARVNRRYFLGADLFKVSL